jgi:hypothetical protein
MNIIRTSFFYKIIHYIDEIHEYSFLYKTRKKQRVIKESKFKSSIYKYSFIYKVLCAIGNLFSTLFNCLNKVCNSSLIINIIGKFTSDIKYKKLKSFNQYMISFIIGYIITNIVLGLYAAYKIKYIFIFCILTLFVNIVVYLYNKFSESSLIIRLINKIVE